MRLLKSYIRRILNSAGNYAIEAEVELDCGARGIASSPSAIVSGRREAATTEMILFEKIRKEVALLCELETQIEWDNFLMEKVSAWGTDVVLALSLAYARAKSQKQCQSLVSYIRSLLTIDWKDRTVIPLAALFSGGIHSKTGDSFQQIMLVMENVHFNEAIEDIRQLYTRLEKKLISENLLNGYSASSGMLVSDYSDEDKLELLAEELYKYEMSSRVSIAVDVAAEHLKCGNGYFFEGKVYEPEAFRKRLENIVKKYPISYLEDPFDPDDLTLWRKFYSSVSKKIHVAGDDLFATQTKYLDNEISNCAVVKMNQVGTLSGCLDTVCQLQQLNMDTCVSHRSYETEDTFMCDLAVAVSAKFIKIGGPRRGDRIQKYNQLIRLYEER